VRKRLMFFCFVAEM